MDIKTLKLELLERIALIDDEARLLALKRLLDAPRGYGIPNEKLSVVKEGEGSEMHIEERNYTTVEHGQATNEVNLIQRDHNYGWFAFDAAFCTNVWPDSCTSPTFQNTLPIAASFFQAPSGSEYYASAAIPELTDKLISCILWAKGLKTFTFNAAYDSVITQGYLEGGAFNSLWRIRDIAIRPDGGFYLITNDRMNARIRYVHPDLGTASHASDRSDGPAPWPNPVHDQLSVPLPPGASWTLRDAQGRTISAPGYRVGDRLVLRLGELPSGLYLFSASRGSEQWVHRLVRE